MRRVMRRVVISHLLCDCCKAITAPLPLNIIEQQIGTGTKQH